jgi:mannobiose 2-epimerase
MTFDGRVRRQERVPVEIPGNASVELVVLDKELQSAGSPDQFDLSFRPIPAIVIHRTWNAEREGKARAVPTDTTSYGHNIELAWLLNRALQTVQIEPTLYRDVMHRLLDHAVAHGVDWEHGGMYRDGTAQGGPLVLDKEFWQNAEALVGFLDDYETLGKDRFLDAFENVWRFVDRCMIDHTVGEWRTLLDRAVKPIDSKIGNPSKVAYHSGPSVLECVTRLNRLQRAS